MRRLPVYILIQTSGAMRGEPIEAIKVGLETMVSSLRQDPFALESVCLSVITYNRYAEKLVSLTDLEDFRMPHIKQPSAAGSHFGEALHFLCKDVSSEIRLNTPESKGDWMPLLFIMSDGRASDSLFFKEMIPKLKKINFGSIIACSVGLKTNNENLKQITNNIISLETSDSGTFKQFFKWVSASISMGNKSIGASDELLLPPPPAEIHVII